jgi:hypothetical protein
MTFEAIYYTDNENDAHDGYRVFEAANLQDAKSVLKALLGAEGIAYRLDILCETAESFDARCAA